MVHVFMHPFPILPFADGLWDPSRWSIGYHEPLRMNRPSKRNYVDYVSWRKEANCRCHSGCMTNGRQLITWKWLVSWKLVGLTRPAKVVSPQSPESKPRINCWIGVAASSPAPSPASHGGLASPCRIASWSTRRGLWRRRIGPKVIFRRDGTPKKTCRKFSSGMRHFSKILLKERCLK